MVLRSLSLHKISMHVIYNKLLFHDIYPIGSKA
jgi:hypothetical protein